MLASGNSFLLTLRTEARFRLLVKHLNLLVGDDEFVTTAANDDDVEYMVVDTVSNIDGGGWTLARDGSQGQGGTLPSREGNGDSLGRTSPHLWIWSPCTVILITLML